MWYVKPVPCEHIHAFYERKWLAHKCIAWQFLRIGYLQWSRGYIETHNNLYGEDICTT